MLWFIVLHDGAKSSAVALILALDVVRGVVNGRGGVDKGSNGNGQDDGDDSGDESRGDSSRHRAGGLLKNEEGVNIRHSEVSLITIAVAAVVSVGSAGCVVAAASLGVNSVGVKDAGGIDGVGSMDEVAVAAVVAASAAGISIVYVKTQGQQGVIAV